MHHAHAELGERAEQRHLLGGICPVPSQATDSGPCFCLDGLEARRPCLEDGFVPGHGLDSLPLRRDERRRRASGPAQRRERLPALGAGHAEVDGIVRGRREADGLPFSQVDVEAAASRAEAADHRGGLVGRDALRARAQAEPRGLAAGARA